MPFLRGALQTNKGSRNGKPTFRYPGSFGDYYIIKRALARCLNKPIIIIKYVDDLLAVVPRGSEECLREELSSVHEGIIFKMEVAVNDRIPYLDLLLHLDRNKIRFTWWRKPFSSMRILNSLSAHPTTQKLGVAIGFAYRILLAGGPDNADSAVHIIMKGLERNNYSNRMSVEAVKTALVSVEKRTGEHFTTPALERYRGEIPDSSQVPFPDLAINISRISSRFSSPVSEDLPCSSRALAFCGGGNADRSAGY